MLTPRGPRELSQRTSDANTKKCLDIPPIFFLKNIKKKIIIICNIAESTGHAVNQLAVPHTN